MIRDVRMLLAVVAAAIALATGGCASVSYRDVTPESAPPDGEHWQSVGELSEAIRALGPAVDPEEADAIARTAVFYPLQLAEQYELTTPPLMHNTLVNLGFKPRGLCIDWTRDLLVELYRLRARTVEFGWGVANDQAVFAIEHSTAVVYARGATLREGIVLDPWRNSGRLFWAQVDQDPRYEWHPLDEVQARKQQARTRPPAFDPEQR